MCEINKEKWGHKLVRKLKKALGRFGVLNKENKLLGDCYPPSNNHALRSR